MVHDLGQVGLDLAALYAPLGVLIAAFPAAVALAMCANINSSFGSPANSQKASLTRFVQHVPSRCAVPLSVLGVIG